VGGADGESRGGGGGGGRGYEVDLELLLRSFAAVHEIR